VPRRRRRAHDCRVPALRALASASGQSLRGAAEGDWRRRRRYARFSIWPAGSRDRGSPAVVARRGLGLVAVHAWATGRGQVLEQAFGDEPTVGRERGGDA
jgi:hypothetical protein